MTGYKRSGSKELNMQGKTDRRGMRNLRYVSRSEKETFFLGEKLAQEFCGREVVLLFGELGSGKTIFAKGIASGLGMKDIHRVCSPSYTLVNIYQARYTIFHIDLYRLEKEEEIKDLGWEDFLGQGIIVVEWGEKVDFLQDAIHVFIEIGEKEEREIVISRS